MTRQHLIRMFVLNEISDDYEEPHHVHENLVDLAENLGLEIHLADVISALCELIELNYAKAYTLSPYKPITVHIGVPAADDLQRCYYYITEEGRIPQAGDDWYPIDDGGELKADWPGLS